MEQGALSNMDQSHHCKLMRVCRDWGSLLHDGMACSRSRAGLVLPLFEELQGKQLPHSTASQLQRCGGRWRRGARRSVEGDGCDMQS